MEAEGALHFQQNSLELIMVKAIVFGESIGKWWLGAELNRRHKDFQSSALPTELPSQPRPDIESSKRLFGKTESCPRLIIC
jgi:hypothetical protein